MYYIMKNIKTLEEYLKEGFDADVKTTEKGNTFRIQLPDEDSTRTFRLDKDSQPEEVLDNDKISPIDKSNPLNKFVKGAINGIRNIKEQDRANEIERVSGNYPELIDDVRRAYDNGIIRINKPNSDEVYSLLDKIKGIEVGTVDKEKNYISFKNVTKSQGEWFEKTAHQVGKGEFYLPILFPDVYKNTKEEVGDNKLKNNNNEGTDSEKNEKDEYIDLEIKTSGAHFKFEENGKLSKNEIDFVKKNKYDNSTKAQFKTLISKTIINYLLNRNTNYNEIDLILFDNQNTPNPNGIFVLRLNKSDKDNSNKVNNLATELERVIEIDDSFGKSDDFDIRYDNTKKSIIVRLSSSKYNSKHIFKETLTDDEMDSMIQNFFNGKSKHLVPDEKKRKHISDNDGKWPIFRMKFIKAAIDNGWSRVKITKRTFGKDMTENFEEVFEYINDPKNENLKNFDIIKFIWDEKSDYIKSKDIKPEDIDNDMLKDFIRGEGTGIDKLIKLMIDKEVDFSELIFGEARSKDIKDTILKAENNNIKANNLIVNRNPPRCKRTIKKELTEGDVIKIINGYCSDNLDTQTENIQTEDIQADGKQGKRLFISWLTRNLQKIKNNGLLSQSNLEKKLNKSEETLKKEENNDKEFLNKKQPIRDSYHIQTFDEMFND